MDVDLISNTSIDRLGQSSPAQTTPVDGRFAATMADQLDEGTATVSEAERLVGTRIRAPEGGCGCDAFVDTVAPTPQASPPVQQAPGQLMRPTRRAAPTRETALPGQVISFEDPSDLGDHLHRAILRNATEMITAHRNGVVEVLSIPWGQAQKR